jgi:hypothetical protein
MISAASRPAKESRPFYTDEIRHAIGGLLRQACGVRGQDNLVKTYQGVIVPGGFSRRPA